jgi:hypothetical protein
LLTKHLSLLVVELTVYISKNKILKKQASGFGSLICHGVLLIFSEGK